MRRGGVTYGVKFGYIPGYTPELYEQKVGVLYQHVFDSCQGLWKGLYAN